MRRFAGRALLASFALLPLLGEVARAEGAEVRAANQLEVYYDTNLEESILDDRLDLDMRYGQFSAGIVFLAHNPSDAGRLDPNGFGSRQEGIRKRWVAATHGPLEARLGDVYATFGHGLVLRILEDQSVDFDNVVDGGHVRARLGMLAIEGIGGTNSLGSAQTMVKGLSGQIRPFSDWTIGLHGAVIDSVRGEQSLPGRDDLAGILANGSLPGGIGISAEYAVRHYRPERPGRSSPADGHAGYLSATGGIGPFSLLLEGKDLLRFQHPYATPPTAVRQHTSTLLNRGSHVPNIRLGDERGFQAELLASPAADWLVTANYSRSEARHAELPAWEIMGEIEGNWIGSHWIFRAAETEEKVREGADRVFFERLTLGGEWGAQIGAWALDVNYETQATQELDLARATYELPKEYRDQIAAISISRTPRHSWAVTAEWSDSPRETKASWVWVEWNIRLGLVGQLTLGGGALRGGQVCSGGICKIVDPFEGGRLELLANF